jgi:hypothetical protein
VLISFYLTIKPFGWWKPVRIKAEAGFSPDEVLPKRENTLRAILNTFLGMIAIAGFYLFPMYLTGHWHLTAFAFLFLALVCSVILYFTWYPHLPKSPPNEP